MKRKLQLKQKIMIGAGAGLLGATAIATPLAITLSRSHTVENNDFDTQYGLDRTVYNNMKGDLTNKYRSNLEAQHLSDEEINARMTQLTSSLSRLDNAVQPYANNSSVNTYFAATSTLMQKAKFDYGVDLVRNSRANWNEIEDMFKGMSNSFDTYMSNHGFDRSDINQILTAAANQKENLVAKLKAEYSNDTLGGVLKAKIQLLSCFDAINTEIARLAAEVRLIEFTQNYVFEYKERVSEQGFYRDNRLNVMKKAGAFKEGEQISNDNMNKIFTCYNVVTRQKVNFDYDNMIPGYRLIPVFAGTVENPLTNEYSIKIDWRAVSQNFAEGEKTEAATAHLVDADREFADNVVNDIDNIQSVDYFFDNHVNKKIKLTEYKMLATADFESKQLSETYFDASANGANIQFVWDPTFNPCYDGLMYADQKSTEAQTINLRQLALTNIAIKANGYPATPLKDVITTVEQENYEPKNIIESFVKYCDVVDTVQINRSGTTITSITNDFTAYYKNQVRWDMRGQESIGAAEFGTTMDAKNLKLSDAFYYELNQQYNHEHHDAYILLDDEYQDLYGQASDAHDSSFLALYLHGAGVLFYLILTGWCIYVKHFKTAFLCFCVAFMSGLMFTACLLGFLTFLKKFYNPSGKYKDNADKFTKGKSADEVKSMFAYDLEHYFVLIDDEHPFDPDTYERQKKKFLDLDPMNQQALVQRYYFFKSQEGSTFYHDATNLHINPDQFREDFASWKDKYGEDATETHDLSTAADVTMGLISLLSAKFDQSFEKEEVKKQAKTDEVAKKASDEPIEGAMAKEIKLDDPRQPWNQPPKPI